MPDPSPDSTPTPYPELTLAALDIQTATDIGGRQENQDAFLYPHARHFPWSDNETPSRLKQAGWLFALADGVGSRPGSGQLATQALDKVITKYYHLVHSSSLDEQNQHQQLLLTAISNAAAEFIALETDNEPPATTLALALVIPGKNGDLTVITANLGDSPIYLFGTKKGKQLTTDHVNVDGRVTHTFPRQANQVDCTTTTIKPDQRPQKMALLLCTDGVSKPLRLGHAPTHEDLNYSAQDLVARSVNAGGPHADNATALIIPLSQFV